jgi:Replication initiator protein A
MEAQQEQSSEQKATPLAADKLYMENTLLRVSGALFCHDAKRAPTRTQEIELNRGVTDKNVVIRPDPRLGQPGPLAHKIFVALIKKHSNYGRPIQSDVSFTKRELMRLIGRRGWGGRHSEQLTRALDEIHHAFIRTNFKLDNGRYAEHSFNIFPEVYLERAEVETDPIETCTVSLARPIIASLQDEHFTCLNHTLMQKLGTIGQALYMRLFFHFANLYQNDPRKRPIFSKRYADICTEWLGGLTVHKHRSTIERDQLGQHLRQLRQENFLASYTITDAARGDGFVMTFRPGLAFVRDYDRFYRGRHQGEMQFELHTDRQEVAQPLKVAYLFLEKRTGQPIRDIPYVSSKEVETARQLLARVPFEEVPNFLDYALSEAKKTRFDIQTLGGLKQYIDGYLQRRETRPATLAAQAARTARDREEADQVAFDQYRRQTAEQIFAELPPTEQQQIEVLARGKQSRTTKGPLAETLFRGAKTRLVADRHPERILAYDTWKTSRANKCVL